MRRRLVLKVEDLESLSICEPVRDQFKHVFPRGAPVNETSVKLWRKTHTRDWDIKLAGLLGRIFAQDHLLRNAVNDYLHGPAISYAASWLAEEIGFMPYPRLDKAVVQIVSEYLRRKRELAA